MEDVRVTEIESHSRWMSVNGVKQTIATIDLAFVFSTRTTGCTYYGLGCQACLLKWKRWSYSEKRDTQTEKGGLIVHGGKSPKIEHITSHQ
jgi:hypothetical protein